MDTFWIWDLVCCCFSFKLLTSSNCNNLLGIDVLSAATADATDEAVLAAINVAAQQDRRGGRGGDDGIWETRQGWTAASVLKRKFVCFKYTCLIMNCNCDCFSVNVLLRRNSCANISHWRNHSNQHWALKLRRTFVINMLSYVQRMRCIRTVSVYVYCLCFHVCQCLLKALFVIDNTCNTTSIGNNDSSINSNCKGASIERR
jgi:hypothetical protein